jgi:hypothetical protein
MLSFVQQPGQAATWPEQSRRESFEPCGKAMFSFGVSSFYPLLCNHLTWKIWSIAGLVPHCTWRELQEGECLAGFYVKLGSF